MLMRFEADTILPPDVWKWPYVHPWKEWACKGSGSLVYETDFLDRLHRLRMAFARPLRISSGYRSPVHNNFVASSGFTGPHTTARAVDIRIYGADAFDLIRLAQALGFTGIGVSQAATTPHPKRYIHLDDLPNTLAHPRPWVWSY